MTNSKERVGAKPTLSLYFPIVVITPSLLKGGVLFMALFILGMMAVAGVLAIGIGLESFGITIAAVIMGGVFMIAYGEHEAMMEEKNNRRKQ